jgi:hypothetical protein
MCLRFSAHARTHARTRTVLRTLRLAARNWRSAGGRWDASACPGALVIGRAEPVKAADEAIRPRATAERTDDIVLCKCKVSAEIPLSVNGSDRRILLQLPDENFNGCGFGTVGLKAPG